MIVSVQGAELFCSTHGNLPAGPPCLFLSAVGTRHYELQTPPELSDRFRLVYVDLRGSGQSTGEPTDLTFDLLAEDLEAVRRALGVERVAVLGHSILSVLAIEYGRRRPGSVSHVITAGAPPYGDMARISAEAMAFFEQHASEERKQILRENLAGLTADTPRIQHLVAQRPMRFFDPHFDAAPLFEAMVPRPQLVMHVMGKLAAGWDVTADAGSLRVPLLLAHGRHDYVVPYTLWDGIPRTLPNATFEIFERSGHQPFFEEPDRFAETVASWFAKQTG
ncbi:MAG TPA: alpha/beta hydrolase [Thermoanaerobaculia bacterium]|jgi:proline iminopeptidase|nr:alpha/beta hydrolase [Thermoanaerobaculia bacterium]